MKDLMLRIRVSALREHVDKVRGLLDAINIRMATLTDLQGVLEDSQKKIVDVGRKLDNLKYLAEDDTAQDNSGQTKWVRDSLTPEAILRFHAEIRPIIDSARDQILSAKSFTASMKRDSIVSRIPDLLSRERFNECIKTRTDPSETDLKLIKDILDRDHHQCRGKRVGARRHRPTLQSRGANQREFDFRHRAGLRAPRSRFADYREPAVFVFAERAIRPGATLSLA